MAVSFPLDAPVLALRAATAQNAQNRDALRILWPVWLQRVAVAPSTASEGLNVVQRAVLAMTRAGVRKSDDIGRHLRIHTELAAHVLQELQSLKYLDASANPLDLRQRAPAPEEVVHLVRDARTLKPWPRLIGHPSPQATQLLARQDRTEVQVRLGTSARDRWVGARDVRPATSEIPGLPTVADVQVAHELHRKHLRNLGQELPDHLRTRQPRIQVLESTPLPWFVLLVVRPGTAEQDEDSDQDEHAHSTDSVRVWDPVVEDNLAWIRLVVTEAAAEHPPLQKWLSGLREPLLAVPTEEIAYAQEVAEERLAELVPGGSSGLVGGARNLAQQAVRELVQAQLQPDQRLRRDAIGNSIVAATRLVETTLYEVAETWPCGAAGLELFDLPAKVRRQRMQDALHRSGMEALPDVVANLGSEDAKKAVAGKPLGLVAIMYTACLGMALFPDHPLHPVGRRRPDLLRRFSEIGRLRNPAAHGFTGKARPDLFSAEPEQLILRVVEMAADLHRTNRGVG